jgi:hypothetical protein
MGMFDGIFGEAAPLAAEAAGMAMGMPPGTMSMVGSALGGIGSYMGQESANAANAAQSQKQMDFQERMRSTQYQTAVEDMKKAGLNPMLAYQQGGAGNQAGAQAQMQSSLGAGIHSTAENLSKYQDLRNIAVQEKLINSQIDVADADAVLKRATAITEAYKPGLTRAQTNNILKQAGLFTSQTRHTSALADLAEHGKAPTSDRPIYQDIKDIVKDMSSADQIRKFGKFINKMPSPDSDSLPNTMR